MKYIISIVLLLLCSMGADAQQRTYKSNRDSIVQKSIRALKNKFSVTAEQAAKIKLAREEEFRCIDSVNASHIQEMPSYKSKINGCAEIYRKKFHAILSNDQLEQYKRQENELMNSKRKQNASNN